MSAETIAGIMIGIFAGPIFAIGLTPIVMLLRAIFVLPFLRKGYKERAIEKGNVIQAKLVKHHNVYKHNSTINRKQISAEQLGVYEYEYKGKKRKYYCSSFNNLNDTITLYYIKNPKKATVARDLGTREVPWIKTYLILSLTITIIISLIAPTILPLLETM